MSDNPEFADAADHSGDPRPPAMTLDDLRMAFGQLLLRIERQDRVNDDRFVRIEKRLDAIPPRRRRGKSL